MDPFNLARKAFHMLGFFLVIVFYFNVFDPPLIKKIFQNNTRTIFFYISTGGVIIMAVVEILRFRFEAVQRLFLRFFGRLLKTRESERIHASLPFFISCAVCFGFFPRNIAIVSILFLVAGDPAAAWFGGKYGKHRFANGKSREGMLAGISVSFLSGFAFLLFDRFWGSGGQMAVMAIPDLYLTLSGVLIVLAGAVTAFTVELFAKDGLLDDNLLLPLSSGLVMILLSALGQNAFTDYFYPLKDLLFPL